MATLDDRCERPGANLENPSTSVDAKSSRLEAGMDGRASSAIVRASLVFGKKVLQLYASGQPWVCCESMSMREPSTVQCIACTVRARAVQFITTRPYCTVRAPATAPIHVMSHIQYVRRHCRDRGSPRSPVPPSRRPRLAAPGAPERAVRAAASHHTHTARARPRQPHAARTCANAGGALVSLPLSRARYAAARALLTCSSRASSSRAADHG